MAGDQIATNDAGTVTSHSLYLGYVDQANVKIHNLGVSITNRPSWSTKLANPGDIFKGAGPRSDSSNCNTAAATSTSLVHSVSADLRAGTLTAILGGSGAGKTTLLDAISQRSSGRAFTYQGVTTFNGVCSLSSIRHAYVVQQDVLLPTLTARETLQYAAELRLPSSIAPHERRRIVDNVIRELDLQHCADTQIGSSWRPGCSGGEKRRVCVGVQVLTNPSVLLLDEPTTGLDASTALQLVKTLKGLAQKGRVVVMTIHQPRSAIWDLLDNVIVLTKNHGAPAFSGPASQCLEWFESQGFTLPRFTNPADFVIDIISIDHRSTQREQESRVRVGKLCAAWLSESGSRFPPLSDYAADTNTSLSLERDGQAKTPQLLRQVYVLTRRTMTVTYRDKLSMTASMTESIIMGLAVGYLFYDIGKDEAGIKTRQGCLYVAATLQGYIMLIFETYRVTLDIAIFDREAAEGCVGALSFILSRRLARVFTEDIPVPLTFATLVYFMAGFDREAGKFFVFAAITILAHYAAITCATLCVVIQRQFAMASLVANIFYILQTLASGFIIHIGSIPSYVRWIRWITYTFYIFVAYVNNEFQGSLFDCPSKEGLSCEQYTGEYVISSLSFPHHWLIPASGYLAIFSIAFSAFSVLGLKYHRPSISASCSYKSDRNLPKMELEWGGYNLNAVKPLSVGLDQFALQIESASILGKSKSVKPILRPLNARFEAGILNVIIGPSGSGKTSLLNAISSRLRNTVGTSYILSGRITFGDNFPSQQLVKSVCSHVRQTDDALLPSLTVRETLRYAAALRLPASMTPQEKNIRAEEVLLKMGLKDCADICIGGELAKGISGGEKRRVSIAIQILTNPQIMLVDEPTSGLDAFNALSVVQMLQDLANEGRTIIIAMHQARSDIFKQLGSIMLLARGGYPVYFGAAKDIVDYFEKHGYRCPEHANPADFVLDIISEYPRGHVDADDGKERVQRLIDLWAKVPSQPVDRRNRANILSTSKPENIPKTINKDFREAKDEHRLELGALGTGSQTSSIESVQPLSGSDPNHTIESDTLGRSVARYRDSFPILLRRSLTNTMRQPQLIMARIMQPVGTIALFALFFAPLDNDLYSVQTRMGLLQQLGGFYIVGTIVNVSVYPFERDVFYMEHDDGVYGVGAFLATYTTIELPFNIISSFIFGIITTFAIGLPHTPSMYFTSVYVCFTCLSCGESISIIFNTLISHTGFAINLMGVLLALANSMAGILALDMPALFRFLNYASPVRYTTRAIAYYSLSKVELMCKPSQLLRDGGCPITTGDQVLDLYGFDQSPVNNLIGMMSCIVVYRVLAWLVLGIKRNTLERRKPRYRS